MNLYESLLAKAEETNLEVNKLRGAGEYSCSIFLQTGFIDACKALREANQLDNNELKKITEMLQRPEQTQEVTADMLETFENVDKQLRVEFYSKDRNPSTKKFDAWDFICHTEVPSNDELKSFKIKGKWAVGQEIDGAVERYPLKGEQPK